MFSVSYFNINWFLIISYPCSIKFWILYIVCWLRSSSGSIGLMMLSKSYSNGTLSALIWNNPKYSWGDLISYHLLRWWWFCSNHDFACFVVPFVALKSVVFDFDWAPCFWPWLPWWQSWKTGTIDYGDSFSLHGCFLSPAWMGCPCCVSLWIKDNDTITWWTQHARGLML